MKRMIEDELFYSEFFGKQTRMNPHPPNGFVLLEEPDHSETGTMLEEAAWITAQLQDGVISNEEFMRKTEAVIDGYKKLTGIGAFDIDTTIAMIRKILIRAAKIKTGTKKMKRRKRPIQ